MLSVVMLSVVMLNVVAPLTKVHLLFPKTEEFNEELVCTVLSTKDRERSLGNNKFKFISLKKNLLLWPALSNGSIHLVINYSVSNKMKRNE